MAAPVKRKPARKPSAVVGKGETDEVVFSRAVPLSEARTRKSLTIHHLQRRLTELGFFVSDIDGRWQAGTQGAVEAWQKKQGDAAGRLTPKQFLAIFEDDPNVTAVIDIPWDGE